MKKLGLLFAAFVLAAPVAFIVWVFFICTVPAGYVGVLVNLYADKGVQNEVKSTGRYFLTINEQMYLFPTFNVLKNYEDVFVFQTSDAMDIQAHLGVEYNIDPDKAAQVFQVYRKGIDEITEINIRQYISDAVIKHASNIDINVLTQGGKSKLLEDATAELRSRLTPIGIRVIKLSWLDDLRYPQQVRDSINAKIEASQRALLRENEVAQSRAEAQKAIEQARGIAESTKIRAQAEADAIAIKAKALADNPAILQLNAIERWDGKLPVYMTEGAAVPFIGTQGTKSVGETK